MADVSLSLGSFSDTTAQVAALSEAGRELFAAMFGAGAISATLPKSKGEDFARFCKQRGLTVA